MSYPSRARYYYILMLSIGKLVQHIVNTTFLAATAIPSDILPMTRTRKLVFKTLQMTALVAATGCAATIPGSVSDAPGRQSAYFAEFPAALFAAVQGGCQRDSDTLIQVSRTELVCESLPTPEAAASLILNFDGEVTSLPLFVTTLKAEESGNGFAVTTEYFYLVPQKSGEVAQIRFREPQVERMIRRIFATAGGQAISS